MTVSNRLIEQLEIQAQGVRAQQDMHRNNIERYHAEIEEARKAADEKVKEETYRIEMLQPELNNLEYAIGLLKSQMPQDPIIPPVSDPPADKIEN